MHLLLYVTTRFPANIERSSLKTSMHLYCVTGIVISIYAGYDFGNMFLKFRIIDGEYIVKLYRELSLNMSYRYDLWDELSKDIMTGPAITA